MAQIIAAGVIYAGLVLSLGLLLTSSAAVWRSWEPPTDVNAGASLSISDVMLKVDAKSLPAQQVEDRTMVFPARAVNE
ncbi:MAG: hypothetical protein ABSC37_08155 [Xanthobacteraceae bacterium]